MRSWRLAVLAFNSSRALSVGRLGCSTALASACSIASQSASGASPACLPLARGLDSLKGDPQKTLEPVAHRFARYAEAMAEQPHRLLVLDGRPKLRFRHEQVGRELVGEDLFLVHAGRRERAAEVEPLDRRVAGVAHEVP